MTWISIIFSLTSSLNLELEQMDVETTFLQDNLHEEICMTQYEGFQIKNREPCA